MSRPAGRAEPRSIRPDPQRSAANLAPVPLALWLLTAILLAACSPAVPASATATGTATGAASNPASQAPSTAPTAAPPTGSGASAADVAVETVVSGLSTPIALVAPPDDSGRLFVVEQTGRIWILRGVALDPEPFLDLTSRLVPLQASYDERGLLGLAFDPGFAQNGRLFVYYGAPLGRPAEGVEDHLNRLSVLEVRDADPNSATLASEQTILEVSQPQANHSGGALGFGPDGYLYLGIGDGGGTADDDPGHTEDLGNAQDLSKLNGKVLRLDVSSEALATPDRYAIPPDNPFAEAGGRPEIYASGFRNPWRLAWEPDGDRRLLVSDVGYGRYEELDVVAAGGNYGWRVREGAHCLDRAEPLGFLAECDLVDQRGETLTDPILEYTHRGVGIAIVGGYVYRGDAIPALRGKYVFGDYSAEFGEEILGRGSLLVADPATQSGGAGGTWAWRRLAVQGGPLERFVTGMGEDEAGELYVLTRTEFGPVGETGEVLRLVAPG